MLEEITIKNYALISELHIVFAKGLNILSGETGAGKSILIGALGILLGEKGDISAIRSGCEESVVSGVIRIEKEHEAHIWLKDHDIEAEDDTIIIRRNIKKSGRGSLFIQSSPATRKDLQELTALIFDLHGQHEHQSLLSIETQRKLLDRYSGNEQLVVELGDEFQKLQQKKTELHELVSSERETLREKELLLHAVNEIESAKLSVKEEEELKQERDILSQGEKIFSLLEESRDALSHSKNEIKRGALSCLRIAVKALQEISAIDRLIKDKAERLETALYEIEDIDESLRQYHLTLDFSPARLEECEDRLQTIHKLQKKYGDTSAEILEYCEQAKQKLDKMENIEENKEAISTEVKLSEKKVIEKAKVLSEKRRNAAKVLEKEILKRLVRLGMKKAEFVLTVTPKENESGKPACGPTGMDKIEFMISPNQGEPIKPLRDIASGGEISRIMLSIKTVLAESDHIAAMIFDEIDSGIGGEVAIAVGEHLSEISKRKQVLCITHLASLAVRADNHIKVEKQLEKERTITIARVLSLEQRVEEISRMLSGDTEGKTSLIHARELLEKYSTVN